MDKVSAVFVAVISLFASAQIHAAVITQFDDRTTFEAGLGMLNVENFNAYAVDTPFHTVAVDVGAFTLSMTGPANIARNIIDVAPQNFPSPNGSPALDIQTNIGVSLFLTFDSPIFAFGADFDGFNDGLLRTQIFAAGELLSPSVTTSGSRFWGFISDTAFTTVEFRGVNGDGFRMDDVTFGDASSVPTPTVLGLLAVGLFWFGWQRNKAEARS